MAIINVTPDSFSDGGRHAALDDAVAAAEQAVAAGAMLLDVGGESTRPGAEPVACEAECARVVPVISALAERLTVPISVDTSKAAVAAAALAAGATIVNDVSAGRDPAMFATVASAGVPYVLMHMQGDPRSMQMDPRYDDVVTAVGDFFEERMTAACAAGIAEEAIVLDPGIGFGKTLEHNLALLRALPALVARCGRPLLVGLSRKRMLPQIMGRDLPAADRDHWSHLFHAQIAMDAAILRVHDVPGAVDAVAAAAAMGGGCHD